MLSFLFNFCDAIFATKYQQSVSSMKVIQADGTKTTQSSHHRKDVTQVGPHVTANETHRKLTKEEKKGFVRMWHHLNQKEGKKDNRNATTKISEAMGFSEQFPGHPEEGTLDVMNMYNVPGHIAGTPFYPHESGTVDTSHLLCHGGHCEKTVNDITGNNRVQG